MVEQDIDITSPIITAQGPSAPATKNRVSLNVGVALSNLKHVDDWDFAFHILRGGLGFGAPSAPP